jgi:hypothetical protein
VVTFSAALVMAAPQPRTPAAKSRKKGSKPEVNFKTFSKRPVLAGNTARSLVPYAAEGVIDADLAQVWGPLPHLSTTVQPSHELSLSAPPRRRTQAATLAMPLSARQYCSQTHHDTCPPLAVSLNRSAPSSTSLTWNHGVQADWLADERERLQREKAGDELFEMELKKGKRPPAKPRAKK